MAYNIFVANNIGFELGQTVLYSMGYSFSPANEDTLIPETWGTAFQQPTRIHLSKIHYFDPDFYLEH